MAWFRNYYTHPECGVSWTDEWSCMCNDRCPACDAEIEPEESEEIASGEEEESAIALRRLNVTTSSTRCCYKPHQLRNSR